MTQAETTTPGIILGKRLGPFPGRIDSDLVHAYAAATKDPNPGPRGYRCPAGGNRHADLGGTAGGIRPPRP